MANDKQEVKRLIDLNPEWRNLEGKGRCLTFDCPLGTGHRVGIPVGGAGWQISGEDFDTLTVTPSINEQGCWHGWVTNGEVR